MAIALSIAAALSWGLGDFLAGLASRRNAVPMVLLLVQVAGLVVVLAYVLIRREPFFGSATDALSAAAGGMAGVVSLGCFYRALAIGTMSIVAPISASGIALPVVVGLATGNRPSPLQAAGMVIIVGGVILASREQTEDAAQAALNRTSIALALLAAVGFGGFFTLTDAPSDASVPWTLAIARSAALPIILLIALRQGVRLPRLRVGAGLAAIGTFDLAATACIGIANTRGALSVVSVIGGMYPLTTVVLAAVFLHERLRPTQLVGVALAMCGIVAVAAG